MIWVAREGECAPSLEEAGEGEAFTPGAMALVSPRQWHRFTNDDNAAPLELTWTLAPAMTVETMMARPGGGGEADDEAV